jgi:hypothetical protein
VFCMSGAIDYVEKVLKDPKEVQVLAEDGVPADLLLNALQMHKNYIKPLC